MAEQKPNTVKAIFSRDRETKDAVRFEEIIPAPGDPGYSPSGNEPFVGIIYVKKSTLRAIGNPDRIVVEMGGVW